MNRLKQFWHDHKDKVKGAAVGAGAMTVVTLFLVHKTKRGRELTAFEILTSDDPAAPAPKILYVTHQDGEAGYYPILGKVDE